MSEFSSFMLAAGTWTPLSPERQRSQRSNSTSQSKTSRRSRIRHHRASSSSHVSRSSLETLSTPSSPQGPRPAVGDDLASASAHAGPQPKVSNVNHPVPDAAARSSFSGSTSSPQESRSSFSAWFSARQAERHAHADHKYRSRGAAYPATPEDAVMIPSPRSAQENKPFSKMTVPFARTESISSTSGTTSLSVRTMTSTDPSAAGEKDAAAKPFVQRNGRTYFNDFTLTYPLPLDLTELHRQCLRTLLMIQVFGAPVCAPSLTTKPPTRVLEVGCGSGFWSMMCHRYFKNRGHGGISFTGIDIAPLAPGSSNMPMDGIKPDRDMKWNFIQHDLRQQPWPLPSGEFDLVMVKDMSLATPNRQYQAWQDEYFRLLRPGGTLEIWESDQTIRMLRPHVPASSTKEESEEQEAASSLGAYVMTSNTPLSPPLNTFLVEYNHWLLRACEKRELTPVPCTIIGANLLQETEMLTDIRSRRMAIPLSEVRWEREGVGGVVTKGGKSYVESKGKGPHSKVEKKSLTSGQAALRKTALLTVVQQTQALEPILREVSGKSIDEWDVWLGKMMGDLMSESGTSWGECLEVGAWWAKKV